MRPRLLDLFCCQGGAAMGYHRAGFDVLGVDIAPQPRYPFDFVQADALDYLAGHGAEFDAIHASPPCQDHSMGNNLHGLDRGTGWLLGATLDACTALARPWVVENVEGAAMPEAMTLCGTSFGLGLHRHRRFASSLFMLAPPCDPSRVRYHGREKDVFGRHSNSARVRIEWGVEWMTRDGISQSIPPVFTQFIGEQLLAAIKAAA